MSDNNGSKQVIDAPKDLITAEDWHEFQPDLCEIMKPPDPQSNDKEMKLSLYLPDQDDAKADYNLGMWKNNAGKLSAHSFVGAQWLKVKSGKDKEPERFILDGAGIRVIVKPRFGGSGSAVATMLDKVLDDDECSAYLEGEDDEKNQLFAFLHDEPLIPIEAEYAEDFKILLIYLYLHSLYELCRKTIR